MPSACELFAVEIRTDQWETMVHWYRNVLGLRVLVRVTDDSYALLSAGETRLAILGRSQIDAPSRRISLALEVHDLGAAIARLEEADWPEPERQESEEGFVSLATQDPDENSIRLFAWPKR